MKGIILCYLLLSTVGIGATLTAGAYGVKGLPKLLDALLHGRIQDDDLDKPTTEAIPSNEDDEDSIAKIQSVFNVLAQVDMEGAKLMGGKNSYKLMEILGKSLWNTGKGLLKEFFGCKEQDMSLKVLLQELTNEQTGTSDEANSKEAEVRAQLQVLFNALHMMEANMMKEGNSDKERAFAKGINDKIKSITQESLC